MSVFNNYQISYSNPVTVGGTGTAPKYFQPPSGNFSTGVGAYTGPSASTGSGQLAVPGDNQLNGQRFNITAAGDFEVGSGGACPSVTIDLVANTGTVPAPVWTIIASTGAVTTQSLTGVFYPWYISADVQGTTASGIIQGTFSAVVDNVLQNSTPKVILATLSGLNFFNNPVFGLAVRVTFSVSESGNSANMYQFQLAGI
jgi:hypothetical protein